MINVAATVKAMFNSSGFLAAVNAACDAAGLDEILPLNSGDFIYESGVQLAEAAQFPALACDLHIPAPKSRGTGLVYECHVTARLSVVCAAPDPQTERRNIALYSDCLTTAALAMGWTTTTQDGIYVVLVSPGGENPTGASFVPEGPKYERSAEAMVTLWLTWTLTGD